MFDLGFSEFFLIFIVGAIFFRPEDYPLILKRIRSFYIQITAYYYTILDEVSSLSVEDSKGSKELIEGTVSRLTSPKVDTVLNEDKDTES